MALSRAFRVACRSEPRAGIWRPGPGAIVLGVTGGLLSMVGLGYLIRSRNIRQLYQDISDFKSRDL